MTLLREEARNEILTLFKNAWDAFSFFESQVLWSENGSLIILETGEPIVVEEGENVPLKIFYDNVGGSPDATPVVDTPNPAPWARVTLQHSLRNQSSLSGSHGNVLYESKGLLFVQIFTAAGKGLLISDKLCNIVEQAFDGAKTEGGVWFRNARSNEIGISGAWHQTNLVVEFTYDTLR